MTSGRIARDPAGRSGGRGDAPGETLSQLEDHEWPFLTAMGQVGPVELFVSLAKQSHLDIDTGLTQGADPIAGNARIRLLHGAYASCDACFREGARAWRSAPRMTTGLEVDEDGGTATAIARAVEGMPLGMGASHFEMGAFAGDGSVSDHHGSN